MYKVHTKKLGVLDTCCSEYTSSNTQVLEINMMFIEGIGTRVSTQAGSIKKGTFIITNQKQERGSKARNTEVEPRT